MVTVGQLIEILMEQDLDAAVYVAESHYDGDRDVYDLKAPFILVAKDEIAVVPQDRYYVSHFIDVLSLGFLRNDDIADYVDRHIDDLIISVPDNKTIHE